MESLLRWSIENTVPESGPSTPKDPRKDFDPGIIEAILGKPDAVLMKVRSLSRSIFDNKVLTACHRKHWPSGWTTHKTLRPV